jgi:hypothetical protein
MRRYDKVTVDLAVTSLIEAVKTNEQSLSGAVMVVEPGRVRVRRL